jgi:trigger factor
LPLVAGCKHELEITIPSDAVAQETERVINKIKSRARIPGFRPGKAPVSMVKARFGADIRQQVVETLVPRFFYQQVEADGLKVVGTPDISDVHFEMGEPLRFKAEFEVLPEFELQEYRGLSVPYREPEAAEEEVEAALERIREKHAVYRNLDPRPLAAGDIAVVKLESIAAPPGVDPIRQDEIMIALGAEDTLPAFTEGLLGVRPGEEREIAVTYPQDASEARLAGHSVSYRVQVLGLRSKELPELNDELAKDEGDFRDLEELRERVRAELDAAKREEAQREAKSKLVDALVDAHDFPVPEVLVERQIRSNLERGLRSLAASGVDPTKLKLDWKKVQEREQPRSTREVKASLILDRIAEAEHLRATQDEVDRQVQLYARQIQEPVAVARARLAEQGALDRVASQIRHEKTLQFLFEQARKE